MGVPGLQRRGDWLDLVSGIVIGAVVILGCGYIWLKLVGLL